MSISMHLKNWSLMYPDRRLTALAPGYDFVSTIAYLPDNEMALKLERSRRMTDLSLDQLSHLAAKARLPGKMVLDAATDTVRKFMDVWHHGHVVHDVSPTAIGPIEELLPQIPLVREAAIRDRHGAVTRRGLRTAGRRHR